MELWGMQGMVLLAFAIGILFIINYATKKSFLKFIPVSKQLLAIVGIGLIAYAGTQTAWWGLTVQGVTPTEEPTVTPGATFLAEGAETDAAISYDPGSRVFSVPFYENKNDDSIWRGGNTTTIADNRITSVTFTITLYRTDFLTGENAVTKMEASVPTYHGQGENSSITYYPITLDTLSDEYRIEFTPSGGNAHREWTYLTVGPGASKAVTVNAYLYHRGLAQLDNAMSKDVVISTAGGDFILRFTKVGESAT